MRRVTGKEFKEIRPFFELAAEQAKLATCTRAKCGTVIIKDGEVIGEGYNSPPLNDESQRYCDAVMDTELKPKYDKTCCVHAEWRAILDALKRNGGKVNGSTLYFMRIDENGSFTDAGDPFCTVCSRLAMESGVAEFALYNQNGADIYDAAEYNRKTYAAYIN